jgi:DNA-binding NarL/FixJ family response regulator
MKGSVSGRRRIIVVVTDVIFESRIGEVASALGFDMTAVVDSDGAIRELSSPSGALVVMDVQAEGLDMGRVVSEARRRGVPVLAYGRHTKAGELRAARKLGCDVVVPRSTFVEELPALIERLTARRTDIQPGGA